MQELAEGEDHQCKGEATERFWVALLVKNFEKNPEPPLDWHKCPNGHGAEFLDERKMF